MLSNVPVSFAAGFLYLVPVLAFLIAWLWLGQVPSIMTLVGVAVALSRIILVATRGR